MKQEIIIDEKDVKVKISICQKCNGIIRAAVVHQMCTKSKNDFFIEVMKYDLSVKTVSLLEYREDKSGWCNCKYT